MKRNISEKYNIWIDNAEGERVYLGFTQYDYGVRFQSSDVDFAPDLLDAEMEASCAMSESFRCFLIHLGVAANINPIALNFAFRRMAELVPQGMLN